MSTVAEQSALQDVAPGTVVWVRDAEWLVTQVTPTRDGLLVTCQGLSELVSGTKAQSLEYFDKIEVSDPQKAEVVAASKPGYRQARLCLLAALHKTPLPVDDPTLCVIGGVFADSLDYQRTAVRQEAHCAALLAHSTCKGPSVTGVISREGGVRVPHFAIACGRLWASAQYLRSTDLRRSRLSCGSGAWEAAS